MQDHTSSSSLENAIALQKYRRRAAGPPQGRRHAGARQGQIHRRFQPARPGLCRGSCAPPMPTASSAASTPTAARAMPGVLGVWTGTDLAAADYGPFTCGLPLKNRDGSPLLQTNRHRADDRQGALCRRSRRLRGRRDAGAGARRRRSGRCSISIRCRPSPMPRKRQNPARRSSTITSRTMSRSTITMATPPRSMPPSPAPRM